MRLSGLVRFHGIIKKDWKTVPFSVWSRRRICRKRRAQGRCITTIPFTPITSKWHTSKNPIASYAFKNHVNVIVEKPAVLSLADYDKLTALAQENGVYFTVMFHWQHGSELAYYLRKFGEKPIQDIQVKICDNYGVGGVIREEKRGLSGAWLDSGVNALSMLARLLDFSSAQLLYTEKELCRESGLPLYCKVGLQIGKTKTEIVVDWREDKDDKDSHLTVAGEKVWINHTKERVISEVESVECMQMPRLESHYYNYFTLFKEGETPQGRRIHELLFAVNERL